MTPPAAYPPPPWRAWGEALLLPYLVRAADVAVPPGFELAPSGARTLGLLGLVDYRAPSPLVYRELFFLSARVRARRADGRWARGWLVTKMLVDDAASLRAGREEWALPKELARFEARTDGWTIEAEDGARVRVRAGRGVPWLAPARGSVVTLQRDASGLVRFRGDMRGRARLTRAAVTLDGLDGTWRSLASASRLGPVALRLTNFEARMQSPVRFTDPSSIPDA